MNGDSKLQARKSFLKWPIVLIVMGALWWNVAIAGPYSISAHGNGTYGVDRGSIPSAYSTGNCVHCHEQHACIDGSEPAPASGLASIFALFFTNHTSQTDNFCLKCHDNTTDVAASAITNRSYSYRAGGWTADPLDDILEAFDTDGLTTESAHGLDDISTFIQTQSWGYTADSNPCAACHNPHAVQGDPLNAPNAAKSVSPRGYPVSRPSQHATPTTWGLWGDGAGEKMSDYVGASTYQAPYRFNGAPSTYEPDGSGTTNGSNLTDFNTFCTDCHNDSNTIYSATLGRPLRTIDWNIEKHGEGAARDDDTEGGDVLVPYQDAQLGNYVLACTDCHEPHGSPNVLLIRGEVNSGGDVSVHTELGTGDGPGGTCNREWKSLCGKCHNFSEHFHSGTVECSDCHDMHSPSCMFKPCGTCHFHGNSTINGSPYGEPLF
jgi:hypothetical protein